MLNTLKEIKQSVISESKAPKSGIVYKRKRGTHRASSPGEVFANDSGETNRKIFINVNKLSGSIGSTAKHAKSVEFGTKNILARKSFAKVGVSIVSTKLENNIKNGILNKTK